MPKTILISQSPLPYQYIGSWTTMYKNYFEADAVNIDTILCEEPPYRFKSVDYCILPSNFTTKVKRKFKNKPHQAYIDALVTYIKPNDKYIIQVVDNFGFIKALYEYLIENPSLRNQLYIQFFYHGYAPFFGNLDSRWFFNFIDEMVLLTHVSYLQHKNYYTILPCMFSVLHNGIDTSIFRRADIQKKIQLKQKYSVSDKTVFLWCSQDRPKKGLDLILNVWKQIIKRYDNVELWVIGVEKKRQIDHVKFFGKISNDNLPEYLQTSDCYLFPTLWHEGFGLSLVEALHCGNYCIASALGGVPEVLQNGELGTLIYNPHFIEEWVIAIEVFLNRKEAFVAEQINLYTKEKWIEGINKIIYRAKTLID